ncbi:retron Ec67 family RNA-directed DNA polymerase/endonuclease [Marinobacter halotolerans]|uniref:retron Ec67 family RNA-directed DNA polymerase/endonuclease n=1 Tax=Marinobacter halotolerans TaxID=1569211 RepID=UPI001244661A|nr:retron Ec67 family RNA-directed DNA polymerase/endonuclease [Marinobacter halotolerans]
MGRLDELRAVKTKSELAKLLGIKPSFLTYQLYVVGLASQYKNFHIPKKSGGLRSITAPDAKLKSIQSALSNLLLDCVDEINKETFPRSELANEKAQHAKVLKIKCNSARTKQPSLSHGFERKRSILTNAMVHVGQKNVLNIDLQDFFASFNFGRVRGFFIKNREFSLTPEIATTIAKIACFNNELPQGSPSSPVITNLITHSLDIKLAGLAEKYSCLYSRYADDITFSTREETFPHQIMRETRGEYQPGKRLRSEIRRSGFTINNKKTRILYRSSRQDVTGLVVNQKPSVKKEYWRTARAQCHSLFRTGKFTKSTDGQIFEGNINELEGQLNFIDQVDHYNRLRQKPALNPRYHLKKDELSKNKDSKKKRQYLLNSREKTFSKFLFYRIFYANTKTTILTEGKTDNTYLKSAIRELSHSYPSLAKPNPYELQCQFLNYSERTKFLLELHGGGDYFKSFVESYLEKFRGFTAPKPNHPVIIFVDNDKGPQELISRIKGLKGVQIHPIHLDIQKDIRQAEFLHLRANLYLILTPQTSSLGETDIEYFFKDKDRLRQHNGKSFNTVKKRDEAKDLSKAAFAQHIVKSQKKSIDFSDFTLLLDRIVAVQNHYDSIK